ncbi:MAG: hypothetical protein COT74_06415, partial [Bdellovibrionales bacterium CG10_big_fil_rev_8_21_14_0_10_45_34]
AYSTLDVLVARLRFSGLAGFASLCRSLRQICFTLHPSEKKFLQILRHPFGSAARWSRASHQSELAEEILSLFKSHPNNLQSSFCGASFFRN